MARVPYWYKDAIIYELHVRAFADSDGDGIGDFRGLQGKLGYLKDLGVTALWLLPFYPSPLRDDGYDISDYSTVNPIYGSLDDFKRFLDEAHRRELKVITELVLNHTSDQHPWFQRSRRAKPGDPHRDWYVWSETPDRYRGARVIFKDFEHSNWAWDPIAKAYYWHRFYSHQPDLNWENPQVKDAMFGVVDYWFGLGVDGLRLDAVPYLYEREGTSCENLPETHQALKDLRAHVDERFQDRMLLAEANQWPEDAVSYFGQGRGDECHMAFNFPVMPRMFMAVQTEDRFPLTDIIEQTPDLPETAQWALFLRNHDELTLEMVTDEERDYMYRMYADDPQARINLGIRRRLAPLLGNNRRKIELLNGLLFSLPGTPVLYYGDEIGMGDNFYLGDRNGVRTPMQWSSDRNAGFSPANAQRLFLPVIIDPEYHYEAYNVDIQQANPQSLLWWMKRFIALRKRMKAFGRGTLELVPSDNRKILAFIRRHEHETVRVVANLSRFVQPVELNLSAFAGFRPTELLGRTNFPKVTESPYMLTMSPHSFFWFGLRPPGRTAAEAERVQGSTPLIVETAWQELVLGDSRAALSEAAADWLRRTGVVVEASAWKRPSAIVDSFPVGDALVLIVSLEGSDARRRLFSVPVFHVSGDRATELAQKHPRAVVAPVQIRGHDGLLMHASLDRSFCQEMLHLSCSGGQVAGQAGSLSSSPMEACGLSIEEPQPRWDAQGNVSVACAGATLRLFTSLDPGVSPEVEVPAFLRGRARFEYLPSMLGSLQYRWGRDTATVAVANGPARSENSAWMHVQDHIRSYLERVAASADDSVEPPADSLLTLASRPIPPEAFELVGTLLHEIERIGKRVAELHRALASEPVDPAFAPEPFTWHYQRSLYQSMRTHTRETAALLRRRIEDLPPESRDEARAIIGLEEEALRRLRAIHQKGISAQRIRVHSDLHLGRILFTGKEFLFTGFEGDVSRPIAERRLKRSPLWDVASMLRSFHYAAYLGLFGREASGIVRPDDRAKLEGWTRVWLAWVCATFLRAYLAGMEGSGLIPSDRGELEVLLDALLRERAVRELSRQLTDAPQKAAVPLRGLADLLTAVAR